MRKAIIYSIMIVFAILILAGLNPGYTDTSYGLKGGITVTKIYAKTSTGDENKSDSIVRPALGAYICFEYESGFSIQPELLFTMKGGKMDYSETGILVIEEDVFTFLEFPLLFKYSSKLESSSLVDFSVFGGPSLGMLLGTHYKLSGYDAQYLANLLGVDTEGSAKDLGVNTNPFELNLQFGAGITYRLLEGTLTFDIRYSLGLTSLIKTENQSIVQKARGFIVMLGYGF